MLNNKKAKMIILILLSISVLYSSVFAIEKAITSSSSGSGQNIKDTDKESVKALTEPAIKISDTALKEKVSKLKNMKDKDIAYELSLSYPKSPKEILDIKAKLGNWEKVQIDLEKFLATLKLSDNQKVELLNKGYKLQDIDKAQDMAMTYGFTPQEILRIKDIYIQNDIKRTDIEVWEDVRCELGVKKELKISELSQEQSKKIETALRDKSNHVKMSKEKKQDIEKNIIAKNNIKDKDIALCKKYGLENNMDIIFAKSIEKKYNTTLQKVLEIKKQKGSWSEVKVELEGTANEK